MHVYHQFESHFNGHHFLLRNSINSHFQIVSSRRPFYRWLSKSCPSSHTKLDRILQFSAGFTKNSSRFWSHRRTLPPRQGMGTMPSLVELAETESSSSSRNWASNFLTRFPLFPPRHDSYIHLCLTLSFLEIEKNRKSNFIELRSGPIENSSLLEIRLWI